MMKSKKAIIISICIFASVISLIFIGYFIGHTINKSLDLEYVQSKSVEYLCKKYDAEPSDFTLIKSRTPQKVYDEFLIFFTKPRWVDFAFEYEYNDRNFFVNRIDGKFYDDYQLDDIENWCTEWLQENVDEQIIGIELESSNLYWYQKNILRDRFYIFQESDTECFLNNYTLNKDMKACAFYCFYEEPSDNTDYENSMLYSEISEKIEAELNKKLTLYSTACVYNHGDKIEKHLCYYDYDCWGIYFYL